jgi:hypothetical protein
MPHLLGYLGQILGNIDCLEESNNNPEKSKLITFSTIKIN